MSVRLHDTRRGEAHPVEPVGDRPIGLYVCGVTPYDTGHLGHAFTYVSFDVLHRYLEYRGHDVVYVQNLTDIDDDMLREARAAGEDYLELGNRHVARFLADMAALNWLPPDHYPRATEHIAQMQELIRALLGNGLAYVSEGNVYFDVAAYPRYGELSHAPRELMLPLANERGNVPDMPGKRDPLDFVLWQRSLPDEPAWPAPWGEGRPGWHIECSAMSMAYLGPRFEIHGGGADLAFPHHESELVQSEGATGQRPFVTHWAHVGMLRYRGEKMSKSLGNLVLVGDLLRSHGADALRHFLVSHHYRSELDFREDDLRRSADAVAVLRTAAERAETRAASVRPTGEAAPLRSMVAALRDRFLDAMDDDLDTPRAMRELGELARLALTADEPALASQASALVHELGTRVVGLRLTDAPSSGVERAATAA